MNCGKGRLGAAGTSSTAQGPSACDRCDRRSAAASCTHSQAQGSAGVLRAPLSGVCGTSGHPRGIATLLAEVDTKRVLGTPRAGGSACQGASPRLVSRVGDTQANPDRQNLRQVQARADSAPGQARALRWAPAWTHVSRWPARAAVPGPER